MWEKEKLLVTSNFFFANNAFKSRLLLMHQNEFLWCKGLILSSIHIYFNTLRKKSFRKTLWKKVKLLKMSNFTFFCNVFFAICVLKSLNGNISVVAFSFFEFGTVSKWCNREWVNASMKSINPG